MEQIESHNFLRKWNKKNQLTSSPANTQSPLTAPLGRETQKQIKVTFISIAPTIGQI